MDDDPRVVASLRRPLELDGYTVTTCADAIAALQAVADTRPDLVVLDVMMPLMDGFEACAHIRRLTDAPILMLTARDETADKVRGLRAGADDYLVKPFAYEELTARISALLRRGGGVAGSAHQLLRVGDLTLNLATRLGTRVGRQFELSPKEFELLSLFMRNRGVVLARETLMDRVWGWDFEGESNVLEVYVRYLRAKLEAGGESRIIHTVRGAGYILRTASPAETG